MNLTEEQSNLLKERLEHPTFISPDYTTWGNDTLRNRIMNILTIKSYTTNDADELNKLRDNWVDLIRLHTYNPEFNLGGFDSSEEFWKSFMKNIKTS